MAFALGENARLEEGFTPKAGIPPYDEKDPGKSWDYSELIQKLVKENYLRTSNYQTMQWWDPLIGVTWYTQPSTLSKIVFNTQKGESYYLRTMIVDEASAEIVIREGRNSWPTHKKGWRYSIPFYVPEKKATPFWTWSEIRPMEPPSYVQLQALENVEKSLMAEQDMEYIPYRERVLDLIRGGEPSAERVGPNFKYQYIPPIYIDKMLYENGIFISPDLYLDVWAFQDTLLAAGAVAILVGNILWELRSKKRKQKTN